MAIEVVEVVIPGRPGVTGINWKNAGWVTTTTYEIRDGLEHNGSSYRALSNHVSSALTEPGIGANWSTVWEILAKGESAYNYYVAGGGELSPEEFAEFQVTLVTSAGAAAGSAGAAAGSAGAAATSETNAEAWAQSPTAPDPEDLTSKSAKTWADEADASAVQTAADVVTTGVYRDAALTAQGSAEAARDASIVNAQTYATEAAGRAAVADGATFDVQGSGDIASYRYRRIDSGSSTLIATFPSTAAIDTEAFTRFQADVRADIQTWRTARRGGGAFVCGLLDKFTASWGEYCEFIRLRKTWTGATVRLRRASDNVEADFTPDSTGRITYTTVKAWDAAFDCYVVTSYDQSGSGNNRTTASNAAQPRVKNDGEDLFIGYASDDTRMNVGSTSFPNGMTDICLVSAVMGGAATANTNVLFRIQPSTDDLTSSRFIVCENASEKYGVRVTRQTEVYPTVAKDLTGNVAGWKSIVARASFASGTMSIAMGAETVSDTFATQTLNLGSFAAPTFFNNGVTQTTTNRRPFQGNSIAAILIRNRVVTDAEMALWQEVMDIIVPLATRTPADDTAFMATARDLIKKCRIGRRTNIFMGGVLDPFVTAWAEISPFCRLRTSWTGAVSRWRRSTDQAELDVTPDGTGWSDWNALVRWASGAINLRLVTAYDQSGSGNHMTTSSNGQQTWVNKPSGDQYLSYLDDSRRYTFSSSTGFSVDLREIFIASTVQAGDVRAQHRPIFTLPLATHVTDNNRFALVQDATGQWAVRLRRQGDNTDYIVTSTEGIAAGFKAISGRASFALGTQDIFVGQAKHSATFALSNVIGIAGANCSALSNQTGSGIVNRPYRGDFAGLVIVRNRTISDVEAGLYAEAMEAIAPAADTDPVLDTIAFATDIHSADLDTTGTRYYRDSVDKMAAAIAVWNAMSPQPSFLFMNGDIVQGTVSHAQNLIDFAALKDVTDTFVGGPVKCNIGNHELYYTTKAQWLAVTGMPSKYYSFYKNGIKHIVLDGNFSSTSDSSDHGPTGAGESSFDYKTSRIPTGECAWLESELSGSTVPCVIYLHQRLDNQGNTNFQIKNPEDVLPILENWKSKIICVISGHAHDNAANVINGVLYLTFQAMVEGPKATNNAYSTIQFRKNDKVPSGYYPRVIGVLGTDAIPGQTSYV